MERGSAFGLQWRKRLFGKIEGIVTQLQLGVVIMSTEISNTEVLKALKDSIEKWKKNVQVENSDDAEMARD